MNSEFDCLLLKVRLTFFPVNFINSLSNELLKSVVMNFLFHNNIELYLFIVRMISVLVGFQIIAVFNKYVS